MEREFCLSILITLVGGITLLGCGWWPISHRQSSSACALERIAWRRMWLPVMPALTVAAVLCGWALAEPDPVPENVPRSLVLMSIPFAPLFVRAALRGGRALIGEGDDPATATVGETASAHFNGEASTIGLLDQLPLDSKLGDIPLPTTVVNANEDHRPTNSL